MKQIAVGVDIGGTNTVYGLVDRDGVLHGEGALSTKKFPDFDNYLEELFLGINDLFKKIDQEFEIVGIGVGAPNGNYYHGTIDYAANLVWQGIVPFVDKFQKYFPSTPIIITNDANAAAIGEMVYGAARGMKDFIVITLGTGLGSGFVANGEMIYGYDSSAGELGHTTITLGGRECGCGRQGCLETYVSATGIKRTIFKLLADHMDDSKFRSISYNDLEASMITEAALAGDPLAIEAFEYTGLRLGQALANAVAVTMPEAIILFGGLAKAGKYIFEPTKRSMEMHMMRTFRGKVKLLPSGISEKNVAVLGAAALIWQQRDKQSL